MATDVSSVAVGFPNGTTDPFAHLTAGLGPVDPTGSFTAEVRPHHQREGAPGVPGGRLERIARVHAAALRKGWYAYFDTMNVQGERRDQMEQSLEDGGFVVPLLPLNRWYRPALHETGIPHLFILGQPMIPRTGKYSDGGPKWDRDMARLREISSEYRTRLPVEQQAEQSRIGPEAKIAQVIYSTG